MAITYTYKVHGARVASENGLTDVVKEMDITVTGTEGTATFSLPTTVKLDAPEAETFVAFSSLTEDAMIAWISSTSMLENIKQHIGLVIAKELEKAALTSKTLPWAPTSAAPETTPAAE
jgi:hypothetical protein